MAASIDTMGHLAQVGVALPAGLTSSPLAPLDESGDGTKASAIPGVMRA